MRHSNPTIAFLVPVAALIACSGGNDTVINQLTPDIIAAPSTVDFGDVVVLYDSEQVIQVSNAGRAPLSITDIYIEDNDDAVFTVTPALGELEVDDSLGVGITFAPGTYIPYSRDLVLLSNDPDTPELRVPLTGEGVDGPIPDILVTPQSLDFGDVALGATSSTYFTIQNTGDGDLNIGTTTQTGGGAFVIEIDPEGTTLSPGAMTVIPIGYSPTSDVGDSGSFIIESNDPDESAVEMFFLGNGGGDFEYPVAVIDCPKGDVDPPTALTLDGSASSDPQGNEPLLYTWSILEQPGGSTGEIADAAAETTSVFVDAAGDWRVSLTVENSVGIVSAPAECAFSSVPGEVIYVEMTWNTGNSDLDLHLRQDGAGFAEYDGDCCWCNPNPDWGVSGDLSDDPDLSLDNTVGYGPESITLAGPEEMDYTITAHYFADNGGATTTATVKVYVDGVLELTESEVLTHNDAWDVAYVRWPEGVVVGLEESLSVPEERQCH